LTKHTVLLSTSHSKFSPPFREWYSTCARYYLQRMQLKSTGINSQTASTRTQFHL